MKVAPATPLRSAITMFIVFFLGFTAGFSLRTLAEPSPNETQLSPRAEFEPARPSPPTPPREVDVEMRLPPDPGPRRELQRLHDLLQFMEQPAIPWDDAVPEYALPGAVEAYIQEALDGEGVLVEMHCEAYPCVATVAELPWSTTFVQRFGETVREYHPEASISVTRINSGSAHLVTVVAVSGPELTSEDAYLRQRVTHAMRDGGWYPGNPPVHPSDPEAAEPLWLPDLPGAESSP